MTTDYLIGMAGPIELAEFQENLDGWTPTAQDPQGLGGTSVNLICRELLKRGHRLVIFTLDPSISEERIFTGDRLKICVGPYTPRRARSFFRTERNYLVQAIQRERPDFVHAQWTYEFALAAIECGLPHVVTARDAPLEILKLNFIPYRIARTLMAYKASRSAQRIVAVSPHVASHLRKFQFHRKPIDVIPNGMNDTFFGLDRRRHVDDVVAFAAILTGWGNIKNGGIAIEAFAKVHERMPKTRMHMIGSGYGPSEEAHEWAKERGLEAGIIFHGQIPYKDTMEILLHDVDILVHTSLEESFGNTLIEASALGVPVIGGRDSGAVPWVLGDGKYGVLTDVRSSEAVAKAMLELAENNEVRTALGDLARQSVIERFNMRIIAGRYEAIYEQLAHSAT